MSRWLTPRPCWKCDRPFTPEEGGQVICNTCQYKGKAELGRVIYGYVTPEDHVYLGAVPSAEPCLPIYGPRKVYGCEVHQQTLEAIGKEEDDDCPWCMQDADAHPLRTDKLPSWAFSPARKAGSRPLGTEGVDYGHAPS